MFILSVLNLIIISLALNFTFIYNDFLLSLLFLLSAGCRIVPTVGYLTPKVKGILTPEYFFTHPPSALRIFKGESV